jgi:phosphotransferase system  glucose/maltose/N-acetylglucosamine-specific IIC component
VTAGAWVMLTLTWSVIFYFTFRFFWKVLTSKRPQDIDDTEDGILRKDA